MAHGLDGTLVPPDWPPLTMLEVRDLLREFPELSELFEILTISPRPFSAASVVATRTGRVFIKRHHRAVRDKAGLAEEHRFMAHLLANGAPVPRVLAAMNGDTAIERGDWTYEVHGVSDGVDAYGNTLSWTPFRSASHARSAGQALARLHLAARGFDAPPRRPRPLVAGFSIFAEENAGAAMERFLAARPALAEDAATRTDCIEALTALAPFHAELLPLLPSLASLWTHNDLHASNLLWSNESDDARAVAVIDFGLADRTNAVHDLAVAIERNIVEWLDLLPASAHQGDVRVHNDHLIALLDGYEEVRPLSNAEAAALSPMTTLCHAEFALAEADYFLGVLHSKESAHLCSSGYLLGHAHWFHSAEGKKLLDAIRGWADGRTVEQRKEIRQ